MSSLTKFVQKDVMHRLEAALCGTWKHDTEMEDFAFESIPLDGKRKLQDYASASYDVEFGLKESQFMMDITLKVSVSEEIHTIIKVILDETFNTFCDVVTNSLRSVNTALCVLQSDEMTERGKNSHGRKILFMCVTPTEVSIVSLVIFSRMYTETNMPETYGCQLKIYRYQKENAYVSIDCVWQELCKVNNHDAYVRLRYSYRKFKDIDILKFSSVMCELPGLHSMKWKPFLLHTLQEKMLAFGGGQHHRLGKESIVNKLDGLVMKLINDSMHGEHPLVDTLTLIQFILDWGNLGKDALKKYPSVNPWQARMPNKCCWCGKWIL